MEYTLLSIRLEPLWPHLNNCLGDCNRWTYDGHFQIFRISEVSVLHGTESELTFIVQSKHGYRDQGNGHRKTQ